MQRDEKIRDPGMYILLSKRDRLISEPLIREHLKNIVTLEKRHAVRQAFLDEFSKKDFDGGLARGRGRDRADPGRRECRQSSSRAAAAAPAPVVPGAHRGAAGGGGGMMFTILLIGLGIFAVLIMLRCWAASSDARRGAIPTRWAWVGRGPAWDPAAPDTMAAEAVTVAAGAADSSPDCSAASAVPWPATGSMTRCRVAMEG